MAQPAKASSDILEVGDIEVRPQFDARSMLKFTPLPALLLAKGERVVEVNELAAAFLGYKKNDLDGKALSEIVRFDAAAIPADLNAECGCVKSDGTMLPVELASKVLPDGLRIVILNDISE